MNTSQRFIFALGSSVAFASLSPKALSQNDDCLSPEVVTDPDLSKLPDGQSFLELMKTDYGTVRLREIRYDFTKANDLVRAKETFVLDFSDVVNGIRNDGYRQTKGRENCNTSLNPRDFMLAPAPDGNLKGGFSIDTTFRACQIFGVPCVEDGYKLTTCQVTWKEDLDSHTFGVNIHIDRIFYTKAEGDSAREEAKSKLKASSDALSAIVDPTARAIAEKKFEKDVDDLTSTLLCSNGAITGRPIGSIEADETALCGGSQFDERGYTVTSPVKNFLLNLIGIATLNIGSKFILDTYRSKLSDAHAAIDKAFSANLPGRSQLLGSKGGVSDVFLSSMKINQTETLFEMREVNGGKFTAFTHVAEHPEGQGVKTGTFCTTVKTVIKQYAALLRSTTIGDQEEVIDKGKNLWSVADKSYGSGYYYVTLLQPNDIAFNKANRLGVGSKISVPAMYKIWGGPSKVVQIGDSLWNIAARDLGAGPAYTTIVEQNSKFLDQPNKIYPIQLLQTGSASPGQSEQLSEPPRRPLTSCA